MMYHIYNDVIMDIRESDLEEEAKINEIEMAKKARLESWVAIGMPSKSCNF